MQRCESSLTREFHPHQYVKVAISPSKVEIGIVVSVQGTTAIVTTRYGYDISVQTSQLQRAFLLVLDLNGVLGARQKKTLFERRPHLDTFLKFALTNFVVAIWTSCVEKNGREIVDDLFGDDRDRLLFCFYRDQCTANPTPERPFGTRKDLQRIFSNWPDSFHAVNTIIVDDSPDKCSHPDLALCPPAYSGSATEADVPDDDSGLLQTIEVLKDVLERDSLEPLIAAARVRLENEQRHREEEEARAATAASQSETTTNALVSHNSSGFAATQEHALNLVRMIEEQAGCDVAAAAVRAAPKAGKSAQSTTKVSDAHLRKSSRHEQKPSEVRKQAPPASAASGATVPAVMCCAFASHGSCTFGTRCRFAHVEGDDSIPCNKGMKCAWHGFDETPQAQATRLWQQQQKQMKESSVVLQPSITTATSGGPGPTPPPPVPPVAAGEMMMMTSSSSSTTLSGGDDLAAALMARCHIAPESTSAAHGRGAGDIRQHKKPQQQVGSVAVLQRGGSTAEAPGGSSNVLTLFQHARRV